MKINVIAIAMAASGLVFAPTAFADLFKCTVGGKVEYQQTPCASGEEKALDDSNRRMYQREREAREREAEARKRLAKQDAEAREQQTNQEVEALTARGSAGPDNDRGRKAKAEQAMRSYFERILIDPSSVQFRNLQVFLDVPGSKLRTKGSRTTPLVDVVCGEVNSKNRMGGYVGFKYFVWDSDEKRAFGPMDSTELGETMQTLALLTCTKLR